MRVVRVSAIVFALALAAAGCDFATGDGVVILSQFRGVSFHAASLDSGEAPLGTASAGARSTYSVSGTVTCLAVAGNRATIGFAVDPDSGFGGDVGHVIFVEDNGSPGAGLDRANDTPSSVIPTSCEPPTDEQLDPFPQFPGPKVIERGEIRVGDDTVSGTTSDRP